MGKKFIRKFLIAEHLIKVIIHPLTPYCYKLPLLRIYTEIFIFNDPSESLVYLLWALTLFQSLLRTSTYSSKVQKRKSFLDNGEGILFSENELFEYLSHKDNFFLNDGLFYIIHDVLHACVELPFDEVYEKQEEVLDCLRIFKEHLTSKREFEESRAICEVIMDTFKITKRVEKAGVNVAISLNALQMPDDIMDSFNLSEEDEMDKRPDEWKKLRKELVSSRISLSKYLKRKTTAFFFTKESLEEILGDFVESETIEFIFRSEELIPFVYVTRKLSLNIWGFGKKIRDNPGGRPLEDTFTVNFLLTHYKKRADKSSLNEIVRVASHIQSNISSVINYSSKRKKLEIFAQTMEIFREREEIWIGMMSMLLKQNNENIEVILSSNIIFKILNLLYNNEGVFVSTLSLFNNILRNIEYQKPVYNAIVKHGNVFFPLLKMKIEETLKKENYSDLSICFDFISLASSNFFTEFQDIFRNQSFAFFTNFVQMLLQVFMILKTRDCGFEMLAKNLSALICLVEGFHCENLSIIRKDLKFMRILNEELKIDKNLYEEMTNSMLRYYSLCVTLISQIFSVKEDLKNLESIVPIENLFEILKKNVNSEWFSRKYDLYSLRRICDQSKIRHQSCSNDKCSKNCLESKDLLIFDFLFRLSAFLKENFSSYWQLNLPFIRKISDELGFVEISKGNQKFSHFFQRPSKHFLLRNEVKDRIVYAAPNDSRSEKLKHLIDSSETLIKELHFKQTIARIKPAFWIVIYWRNIKDINLLFVIIINILLLIAYKEISSKNQIEDKYTNILQGFKFIHLIIVVITLFGSIFDRLPHLRYQPFESEAISTLRLKRKSGNPDFRSKIQKSFQFLQEFFMYLIENKRIDDKWLLFLRIIVDLEILYSVIYLSIAIFSFTANWPYAILLLDFGKRSRKLRIVLNSLYKNWRSLFWVSILILVVLYIFGVYGYLELSRVYPSCNYDKTIKMAFVLNLSPGIRIDGGIGSQMSQVPFNCNLFWKLYAFQLIFYTIVNLILLKIFLGIIIQTFKQLRMELEETEKMLKEKCFICGITKQDFDNKKMSWKSHMEKVHNVFDYLEYMIYLNEKPEIHMVGIEKYSKKMISESSIDIFPSHD